MTSSQLLPGVRPFALRSCLARASEKRGQKGGIVMVGWRGTSQLAGRGCERQLRIKWAESGGPPVTPPATTGYGTRLIQYTTTYSLGGQVEQEYAIGGLEAEIVIPLGKASLAG